MATTTDSPFPSSLPAKTVNNRGNGKNSVTVPEDSTPQAPDSSSSSSDDQPDVLTRVVQGAHQTIDRLAETAAPHAQRLQDGVSSAGSLLHSRAEQAREVGGEWAETLRCTVRENPLAAVGTALALGILVTRLLRR